MKIKRQHSKPYTTKDGSEIRELLHPSLLSSKQQSLAEAIVQPGQTTAAHFHKITEEIYFILQGKGEMFLNGETLMVSKDDSVLIKPGHIHNIKNTGDTELRFLCCCAPAYQHDDTYLIE